MTTRTLSFHGLTRELVAKGLSPADASAQAAKQLAGAPPVEAPTSASDLTRFIVRSTGMSLRGRCRARDGSARGRVVEAHPMSDPSLALTPLQAAIIECQRPLLDVCVAIDGHRRDVADLSALAWGDDAVLSALVLAASDRADAIKDAHDLLGASPRTRDGKLGWLRRRISLNRQKIRGGR